jgi:hypothetical protein
LLWEMWRETANPVNINLSRKMALLVNA